MRPPREPRSREDLAMLAARIVMGRLHAPALVDVEIRHEERCAMLRGARFCICEVELIVKEIPAP